MKGRAFAGGLIASITGLLAVMLIGLYSIASIKEAYQWAMNRAGVYESAGVDRDTLDAVAGDIARYIGERNPSVAFDRVVVMDGLERPELNDTEAEHMRDVRRLFGYIGNAGGAFALACAISVMFTIRIKRGRATGCGMLAGTGAMMMLALAIFIAIRADFYNFFVALHERLFTNDLWYMNPETDLLIRMTPSGFYISMGMIVGAAWLAAVVITLAIGLRLVLPGRGRAARNAV
ncbi:MAG: DUF1461 domain-containing protein [Oscillospiraceae bacterium]|jgi:integral membrane protein (TIGR01906 family)|nr:DUF1461 domain-containing protein [Oscillospiraceae bacterium]